MSSTPPEASSAVYRSPSQKRSCCGIIVFLGALLAGVGLYFYLPILEGFMDDGPFYPVEYRGVLPAKHDEEIPWGSGSLRVYNQGVPAPVIAVVNSKGKIESAQLLDLATHPSHVGDTLTSITIERVSSGLFRKAVEIRAYWTYGHEAGTIYFWRSGRINRFYLSW